MSGTRARDCGVATTLQIYLQDIKDDALLTAAEERELAAAIARGDGDARKRMIEANLRLVVRIARDYVGRGIPMDDLVGEGNLGLIRAAQEFDPRFGTRFSTYASYWIKQAIRHALINTTTTIRLPAHMVGLLTRWRRAERSLGKELRRAPTFEEVASYLGLSETQKTLVARAHRARQLKLESGLAGEANRWSPEEAIDRGEAPESAMEAEDERAQLLSRLDRLDDRERIILSLRYGLEGAVPMTLKEIGRRLGVTREWVRKIELRAVRKLDDRPDDAPRRSARRLPRRGGDVAPPHAAMPMPSAAPARTATRSESPSRNGSRPRTRAPRVRPAGHPSLATVG
jgi:RNA polymerase primary sigma factor